MPTDGISIDRVAGYVVTRRADAQLDAIMAALASPGEVLKSSSKAVTHRVGEWVIKESCRGIVPYAKHALRPWRARNAWEAALFLQAHGAPVPRPIALIERRRFGLTLRSALILEYVADSCSVEDWASALDAAAATDDTIRSFLLALADAVNALCATGAYHGDLSGKNILTRLGRSFHFIDLDGVILNHTYTNSLRLKNHIQLYDSFCDLWGDEFLAPFIARMLPSTQYGETWFAEVRRGQARRRARTEAIWRRQGRS